MPIKRGFTRLQTVRADIASITADNILMILWMASGEIKYLYGVVWPNMNILPIALGID
jgi:hypothetical protein